MPITHDLKTVRTALTYIAITDSIQKAQQLLASEEKIEVARQTLQNWRDVKYVDDYKRIRDKEALKIEADAAHNCRLVIQSATEAELMAIERTKTALRSTHNMRPTDASKAAADMASVKAKNVDELMKMTGRPTQIIDNVSTLGALRQLQAKGIIKVKNPEDMKVKGGDE